LSLFSAAVVRRVVVREDQKDHEIVDFLKIKQKPSEPVYSFIERFEKQHLRTEDMSFESRPTNTERVQKLLCGVNCITPALLDYVMEVSLLQQLMGHDSKRNGDPQRVPT